MGRQIYPEPTVGCFILNRKGEILVVESPKWSCPCVPGGHIEIGETARQAARREAMEEVGMRVKPIRVLYVHEAINPKGFKRNKHFIFFNVLCRAASDKVRIDNDEITGYRWMRVADAAKVLDRYAAKAIRLYMRGDDLRL